MKKNIVAAAVAALALPVAGFAADKNLSYTFGELAYVDMDADGGSVDGLSIEGSFEINGPLFVFAGYEDLSGEGDSSTLMLGAGYALGLTDKVDGFAKLAYVDSDIGFADDSGIGLEFGVRAMIVDQLEGFGSFSYVDIYEDSQTGFELGARYWVMDNLGISLAFRDIEESDGFKLAARYEF